MVGREAVVHETGLIRCQTQGQTFSAQRDKLQPISLNLASTLVLISLAQPWAQLATSHSQAWDRELDLMVVPATFSLLLDELLVLRLMLDLLRHGLEERLLDRTFLQWADVVQHRPLLQHSGDSWRTPGIRALHPACPSRCQQRSPVHHH